MIQSGPFFSASSSTIRHWNLETFTEKSSSMTAMDLKSLFFCPTLLHTRICVIIILPWRSKALIKSIASCPDPKTVRMASFADLLEMWFGMKLTFSLAHLIPSDSSLNGWGRSIRMSNAASQIYVSDLMGWHYFIIFYFHCSLAYGYAKHLFRFY